MCMFVCVFICVCVCVCVCVVFMCECVFLCECVVLRVSGYMRRGLPNSNTVHSPLRLRDAAVDSLSGRRGM
ncbi:unnamed protein product [Boreogadus saida]